MKTGPHPMQVKHLSGSHKIKVMITSEDYPRCKCGRVLPDGAKLWCSRKCCKRQGKEEKIKRMRDDSEQRRINLKRRYLRRKSRGLCPVCGKSADRLPFTVCLFCAERAKSNLKKKKEEHGNIRPRNDHGN